MGCRSLYSLDGQGHDCSTTSYAKQYASAKTLPIPVSVERPTFKLCAYSLDGQGHDLSYPKEYSSAASTPILSRTNSEAMLAGDGAWRAVHDLGQRVYVESEEKA